MTVRVRLFASLRERAGWSERLVTVEATGELAKAATALSLWRQLNLAVGGDASDADSDDAFPAGLQVAINQSFAAPDTPLVDGDELAFLPPISGG